MKTGGHDAKTTKFHMNVAISYIEFVPVKQKYARFIIMSNDFHACEK